MGNVNVGKILPVFDTLLLLVTTLFGTAGLLRSMEQNPQDLSSPEHDRLAAEVAAKTTEAEELRRKREGREPHEYLDLDTLQAVIQAACEKQDNVAEIQEALAEMQARLRDAEKHVESQRTARDSEEEIARLHDLIAQLEHQKTELAKKLALARDDETRLAQLRDELKRLNEETRKLQEELDRRKRGGQWPTGGYWGRYVLVECDDKGAVVYCDNQVRKQIPLETPEDLQNWLKEQVREAGAALVLARPSSFKRSFDEFKEVLTELAREERDKSATGAGIVLTFWPVEEHTSIEQYLPKGNTHE